MEAKARFQRWTSNSTLLTRSLFFQYSVVLDEVDILLDDQEFAEVLQAVDEAASKRVQYVHVTATLPVDIHDSLLTRYPDAIPLMGPTLHQTAVGLQEVNKSLSCDHSLSIEFR